MIVRRTRRTESGKNKVHVVSKTTGLQMLTKLPAYAVYSAVHFPEYIAPEPAAAEKPSMSSVTHKELVREDEDWVFL